MDTSGVRRHQIIKSLAVSRTEKVADASINLWEQMATEIISIVGEGGFNALYARSVFLTQSIFPWLVANPQPPLNNHRFSGLKMSLEEQAPAQASQANSLLLLNFTDILASLIGEQLTISILRSAWGNHAPDSADNEKLLSGHPKEFKNE